MARLGSILISLCILVIAAALGVIVYVQTGVSLMDAVLVAAAAGILMLVLQSVAARGRERADFQRTIEELRAENTASRNEIERIGGRMHDIDRVGVRVSTLEQQVDAGLLRDIDQRIQEEVAEAKASLVSEMQVIESLVRQLAESVATRNAGPVDEDEEARPGIAPRDLLARDDDYGSDIAWGAETRGSDADAVAWGEDTDDAAADADHGALDIAPAPLTGHGGRIEPVFGEDAGDGAAAYRDEPAGDYEDGAFGAHQYDEPGVESDVAFGIPREEPEVPQTPLGHLPDDDVLALVRRSIEHNRVDVYLQPIVTLPQRQARYYEALTRLRAEDGEVILPADYLRVAEPAGIMPAIDNLLLFRSVQIMRQLAQRKREVGIFCNISAYSLVDADFFPQFVEFMQHNRELAGSMVFEFTQATVNLAGPIELESLAALKEEGFRFSLDNVTDLRLDLKRLHDLGFKFIKIDSSLLLDRAELAGAQVHPADFSSLLARHGMKLIAEKVEMETTVVELIDFDVAYGQGFLFSEPRPVRGELLRAADETGQSVRKAV